MISGILCLGASPTSGYKILGNDTNMPSSNVFRRLEFDGYASEPGIAEMECVSLCSTNKCGEGAIAA